MKIKLIKYLLNEENYPWNVWLSFLLFFLIFWKWALFHSLVSSLVSEISFVEYLKFNYVFSVPLFIIFVLMIMNPLQLIYFICTTFMSVSFGLIFLIRKFIIK